jgi:hypothetical protein
LKDEEAIDWCKGFGGFHWTRGTSSRGHGGSPRKGAFVCKWKGKKEEEEEEEEECEEDWLLVLMCARIKHRKSVCKN